MIGILNLCQNSTISTQVNALQSLAAKLSVIGGYLSSKWSSNTMTIMATAIASNSDEDVSASTTPKATILPNLTKTLNFIQPNTTTLPSYPSILSQSSSLSLPSPSISSTIPTQTQASSISPVWIAAPVGATVFGLLTLFLFIFFTRRHHRRSFILAQLQASQEKTATTLANTRPNSPVSLLSPTNHSSKPPLSHLSIKIWPPPEELPTTEIYEMPALEPVGSELYSIHQQDEDEDGNTERDKWPIPLSPLPLLFAMSEMRDERDEVLDSPKHETFYHA